MKVYAGSAAAARVYPEADRGRPKARARWIAVFGRDRAELGPGHAAELAARAAARDRQDRSRYRTAAAPPRAVAPVPSVPRPEAERRGPSLARGGAAPGIGR
ncbi:hypothetical protein [Geodermatophilus marinus]|uniref:hypothetical protein n=1 Tax=Geodermatophilus sp. LHW52908 TaxID=2303986 RepID=UPI001F3A0099|nr:hypothetical protein [Geodermatophilus sp. LHW52908]